MASVTQWRRSTRPDGESQAAIYRERAVHLRVIADAEADPILHEQLRDIARQYDEIANAAVPLREMLGALRHEIARHQTAQPQATDRISRDANHQKPMGR